MTITFAEQRRRLRFIGVTKDATTAGPGKRLELFLKGCIRGIVAPCQGCFNPTTWEFGGDYKEMTVHELVTMIVRDAWNKQITFCGGEPLLQSRLLIEVCKKLKEIDPAFHIVIYTAYTLENLLNHGIRFTMRPQDGDEVRETLMAYSHSWDEGFRNFTIATSGQIRELMQSIDLLVDGDYQANKRIPTEKHMNDGMFVGSSNQRVIDTQETIKRDPQFVYLHADEWMDHHLKKKHCKCCGHDIENRRKEYCSTDCKVAYRKRDRQMRIFGGV
jgi:organic radical activating enzyme